MDRVLPPATVAHLDRFDRVQLEDVLSVCFSAVGRLFFDRSPERKRIANDADRLRKYPARFGLGWAELKDQLR